MSRQIYPDWFMNLYRRVQRRYPNLYGVVPEPEQPISLQIIKSNDFSVDLIISSRPRRRHLTTYPRGIFELWKETEREALGR